MLPSHQTRALPGPGQLWVPGSTGDRERYQESSARSFSNNLLHNRTSTRSFCLSQTSGSRPRQAFYLARHKFLGLSLSLSHQAETQIPWILSVRPFHQHTNSLAGLSSMTSHPPRGRGVAAPRSCTAHLYNCQDTHLHVSAATDHLHTTVTGDVIACNCVFFFLLVSTRSFCIHQRSRLGENTICQHLFNTDRRQLQLFQCVWQALVTVSRFKTHHPITNWAGDGVPTNNCNTTTVTVLAATAATTLSLRVCVSASSQSLPQDDDGRYLPQCLLPQAARHGQALGHLSRHTSQSHHLRTGSTAVFVRGMACHRRNAKHQCAESVGRQ